VGFASVSLLRMKAGAATAVDVSTDVSGKFSVPATSTETVRKLKFEI
jgi:hypothetical protein